ncbi:MAG: hypothetical protein R3B96_15330 [Pirellulaceae bacterium]
MVQSSNRRDLHQDHGRRRRGLLPPVAYPPGRAAWRSMKSALPVSVLAERAPATSADAKANGNVVAVCDIDDQTLAGAA